MDNTTVPQASLSGVPRTLLLTTRARVDEHCRPDAVLHDPVVAEWGKSLPRAPELAELYTPLSQLGWAVRARLFDDIVQRHLSAQTNPVVIELGAGLSTRYYRVGRQSATWLELDLPETTALRQQLDAESNGHRFLALSALDFQWLDELPDGPPESLLVIAEGLFMYFQPEQVQALITVLKQRFPRATLACDVVGGTTRGRTAKQLAQVGAPLKWFAQGEQELAAMGLSIIGVQSLIQEMCHYPQRIGFYRWVPWLSTFPPIRNSSLIIEGRV